MKNKQAIYVSLLASTMLLMAAGLLSGCGKPSTGADTQTGQISSEDQFSNVKTGTFNSEPLDPALVLFGLSSR